MAYPHRANLHKEGKKDIRYRVELEDKDSVMMKLYDVLVGLCFIEELCQSKSYQV